MSAPTSVEPAAQLRVAVRLVREYSHADGCTCCEYRDSSTEGFCNRDHARWSKAVDRLLDAIEAMAAVHHAKHRLKETNE